MAIRSTDTSRARDAERARAIEAQRQAALRAQQEAARRAAAQAAAQHAAAQQAKSADPSEQSAARQRFAMTGGRAGADGEAVRSGTATIAAAAKRIENARGDDDKRTAARDAAKAVRDAVAAAKTPSARQAILEASQGSLQTITKGLDKLSKSDTKKAVAHLADAAEAAGPAGVDALAKPMAQALPALLKGHGDNRGELLSGVNDAVKDGHGALLGAALARHTVGVDKDLAGSLNRATADGVNDVRAAFDGADKKARAKEGELGAVASQWRGVLSDEAVQAGTASFKKEHGEFADRDARASTLARTLAGAGYADAHNVGGDLERKAKDTLGRVPALANTDVGARAIGRALVDEGRGDKTFLRGAAGAAGKSDEDRGAFVGALQRSLLTSQQDALAQGDTRGLVDALRGASHVVPSGPMRDSFQSFAADVEKAPPGLRADQLAVTIAASAQKAAGGLSTQRTANLDGVDAITEAKQFKAFGASLGALALGQSIYSFTDGVSGREALGAVVNAAGLGSSVAGLVLKEGAPKALGKGVPIAGYALSAFDTVSALRRGDKLGAVAAAAPLAGAAAGAAIGAASGSIAPGVGTAIGGAVGAAVGLGIGIGRKYLEDTPAEKFEQSTQSFLRGALRAEGLTSQQADTASHRLRDVNDDFFGAGRSIFGIARATGESPQAVLQKLGRLDDDRLRDFVKQSLRIKDNGEAIRDAEARVADGKGSVDDIPAFAVDRAAFFDLVARYRAL
jgi:hypothetical protein